MKELADLPPSALIAFGAVLAVIYAARHFGITAGKNLGPAGASPATVAAVIVDPRALNRASEAGEVLAARLVDMNKIHENSSHMICRRMEAMDTSIKSLSESVDELRVEMIRKKG